MSSFFKIKVDGVEKEYEEGTSFETIAMEAYPDAKGRITLCEFNYKIRELWKTVTEDGELKFFDLNSPNGMRTYRRSTIFILQKALDDYYGDRPHEMRVMFSLGSGYYCTMENGEEVTVDFLEEIRRRMQKIVEADIPFKKYMMERDKARELFKEKGMHNKELLLKYRALSYTNVYDLEGTIDYFYGYMVPSTGYIKNFDIFHFADGFILQMPVAPNISRADDSIPPKRLYKIMKDSTDWSKILNISTVGQLNDIISRGNIQDMILMQEAVMEEKLGRLAQEISERQGVKFVMIAGPSSSGKTTFSHRLSVHLRAKGLVPHPVPLDDYYLGRDQIPFDEYGEKDFEALEALDVERFNQDMQSLLSGRETELPVYDFTTGSRKPVGRKLQLGSDDILVIEGIHGLNDALSYSLPVESKFKIYISALSMLAIDEHNPLSTTDGRLLRRIVRDARTRGTDAKTTISMWPSVRRGERKNIFPFQEGADYMFNTALIYELAVMKLHAEPLLYSIERTEPEFAEAKRLIKLLGYVLPMPTSAIPNNSLIREFIGGSCFKV